MAVASVNRPPESTSRVAIVFAARSGLRYGSTTMFGMSRTRSVTAATKDRATYGSNASWPPLVSHLCDGAGCSVKPMPSNPTRSAARAKSIRAVPVSSSAGTGCWTIG